MKAVIVARVVLACGFAAVGLLVLRSMSVSPPPVSPTPIALVQRTPDGVPIERLVPLVARAVPVERYLLPPAPPPVLAPVSAPVVSVLPVSVASTTKPVSEAPKVKPQRKRRVQAERDDLGPVICRGKGRYWTNGGRSWRCRRT
jgi:hypothetical protein